MVQLGERAGRGGQGFWVAWGGWRPGFGTRRRNATSIFVAQGPLAVDFGVADNRLVTPRISGCGRLGSVRDAVLLRVPSPVGANGLDRDGRVSRPFYGSTGSEAEMPH